jgi:hypothetical protein
MSGGFSKAPRSTARHRTCQLSRWMVGAWLVVNLISGPPLGPAAGAKISDAAQPQNRYFQTLPPGALLPTGSQCAAAIPATSETIPSNTPFNMTTVTAAELAEFARDNYSFEALNNKKQYARITGDYTGSTDMIMRWVACKYGIDEDVVRGQAWDESWWQQSRRGDRRTSRAQCVQGDFTALWNATIPMVNGNVVTCPKCCWTSWSAWQTKVYYEWMTWPMIKDSTSFAAEYRFADTRGCIDGDWAPYFLHHHSFAGHNSYSTDLSHYAADRSPANLDTILWGCIGSHYSGQWYDPKAETYISNIQHDIALRRWLTPQTHVTGLR